MTVTISVGVQSYSETRIDMDGADFADAEVFGLILVGDEGGAFFDESHNESLSLGCFGFCGGNIDVTIPAHGVIPYYFSLDLNGEVESFCSDECSSTSTPEPGTMMLAACGLGGLLWNYRRARRAE